MVNKSDKDYKGFNKDLTKEDLDEEELKCYNKLMEGIKEASPKEKDDVAHLMEVYLEAENKNYTNCTRCGKESTEMYCSDCLKKMWGAKVKIE